MSEIQEAAEIITSAVSPDANIIFGATLKPDLEDELIITVIATGFDSPYYTEAPKPASLGDEMEKAVEEINTEEPAAASDASADFQAEPSGNIWDQPVEDDESDTPAFLRRRKKKQSGE